VAGVSSSRRGLLGDEWQGARKIWCDYLSTFEPDQARLRSQWLKQRGLTMLVLPADFKLPGWSVQAGRVGKHKHCVVALNGEIAHNPARELDGDLFICEVVVVLAPSGPKGYC